MSQSLTQHAPNQRANLLSSIWTLLRTELTHSSALLLPLRLFIGLGWLRAGVEKGIDPFWRSGDKLVTFLHGQVEFNAIYFPFYETLIHQIFEPNALLLSWIILLGELLAGAAILTGTLTNLALLGGLFMNLNFVLAGAVNPSAFYIVIQGALLTANAGSTLGGDAILSRYIPIFWLTAQPHIEERSQRGRRWGILIAGIACSAAAAAIPPYIRDFGPHSIEDPAMLLFITFMLGAMLLGIQFIRLSADMPSRLRIATQKTTSQATAIPPHTTTSPHPLRRMGYPILLAIFYLCWLSYMIGSNSWHLFTTFWPVTLTMTLGSFVAGATAEGGAAIAFPVFTKVLHIASTDARTFGLMIQAVGMTMAGIVILLKGVKVLPRVILWASLGGILGQAAGTLWLTLPNPYPKILFTFTAGVFGFALIISRWGLHWEPRATLHRWGTTERLIFTAIGICGGAFASITGSGIDMLTFIVLTLAFGINEKISTPTTVIIMALNSIVGFALHGLVLQDIGIAWSYWLVAAPIVVIGAPLGAIAASRLKRDQIILFLLSLITLELVTTILLVPFSDTALRVTAIAVAICSLCFGGMLIYRQRTVPTSNPASPDPLAATQGSHAPIQAATPTRQPEQQSASAKRTRHQRVSCASCYRTQDATNGDCTWCGTSLAFAEPIL